MNYGNGLVASTVCESGYVLLSTAQIGQIQFKRNNQTKQANTSLLIAVRHRQACHGCAGGSNASLQLRSCRLQFPAGAEWSWAGLRWAALGWAGLGWAGLADMAAICANGHLLNYNKCSVPASALRSDMRAMFDDVRSL